MRGPESKPASASRRPAEPTRPAPAVHPGVTLLAARVRRRRHRRTDLR
ncbi:MAG: hypothetical protein M3Q48_04425 [Actinomycetota bacterium]|nr:hypothetical protein [Actinomycetota bacterium]